MSGLALFEIASFSAFAKLLLAARKLAEDGGALDRLKALADLAENGSKLTAALGERDLGPLAARIETDCQAADAAFAREPLVAEARTVFEDAAPVALAQCDAIAKADLQGSAIVQKMVEAVYASDYARAFRETALPESYFRAVMEAALKAMLSDPQFIDGLSSQLWRESLRRQGIEISLLKEVKEDTGAIRADTSALRGEVAALRTMLVDTLERTGEAAAARQSGISDARIVALAQEVAEDVTDPSVAFRELERAVEDAKAFRERAARGSNTDTLVTDLLRRLDALANDGKLAEAQGEADAAVQKWEAEEEAQRERATATGIELLDAALKQDMALRDAKAAARRLVRKAELDGAGNFAALRKLQDDWYVSGRDRGLNLDLEISIEIARLNFDRAIGPDERGNALNDLGISLGELGEREAGTARLEEAVAAYRAALQEWTRERVPLDWARTQMNLGAALKTLGEREAGTARLEEAVAAFRAALEELTRDRVPLQWATAQMNLGTALRALGEREAGTARLEEAVAAYRAALEEMTRERAPLQWATAQMNLGGALQRLGEREAGTARLEQAVAAYRAALEEWTRERVPIQWAMVQFNMGGVEMAIFDKTGEAVRLEAAERHVRAAREVFEDAGASQYLGMADAQLAEIARRREGVAG